KSRAMIRIVLAVVIGVAALVGGLRGCWAARSGPATMTCAQAEEKIRAGDVSYDWLQLTDCEADLASAVVTTSKLAEAANEAKRKKGEAVTEPSFGEFFI